MPIYSTDGADSDVRGFGADDDVSYIEVLLMRVPAYLFAYPSIYDQAIGPRGVLCVSFLTT